MIKKTQYAVVSKQLLNPITVHHLQNISFIGHSEANALWLQCLSTKFPITPKAKHLGHRTKRPKAQITAHSEQFCAPPKNQRMGTVRRRQIGRLPPLLFSFFLLLLAFESQSIMCRRMSAPVPQRKAKCVSFCENNKESFPSMDGNNNENQLWYKVCLAGQKKVRESIQLVTFFSRIIFHSTTGWWLRSISCNRTFRNLEICCLWYWWWTRTRCPFSTMPPWTWKACQIQSTKCTC